VTVAEPFAEPLQVAFVAETAAVIGGGAVIVAVAVMVQPWLSVTVTV
jgi:hypothetical protein